MFTQFYVYNIFVMIHKYGTHAISFSKWPPCCQQKWPTGKNKLLDIDAFCVHIIILMIHEHSCNYFFKMVAMSVTINENLISDIRR